LVYRQDIADGGQPNVEQLF